MSDKEIWKDIEGYEGIYQVSNLGRVRSCDRYVNGKNSSKEFKKGKIKKFHRIKGGYLRVALSSGNKQKKFLVHRLVAEAFIPKKENKLYINHINGLKEDNRAENLEFVTSSENMLHAYKNDLNFSKGNPKLTAEEVEQIRNKCTPFDTESNIKLFAKKYNVTPMCISRIVHNKTHFNPNYACKYGKNPTLKFTIEQIKQIRKEYIPGDKEFGVYPLSRKYNVSTSTIHRIVRRETYKDID